MRLELRQANCDDHQATCKARVCQLEKKLVEQKESLTAQLQLVGDLFDQAEAKHQAERTAIEERNLLERAEQESRHMNHKGALEQRLAAALDQAEQVKALLRML